MADEGERRSLAVTVLTYFVGYVTYYSCCVCFAVLSLPLIALLIPFPRLKYRVMHAISFGFVRFFTHVFAPAMGAFRVTELQGYDRVLRGGPYVFVANHRGRMDGPILLGLLRNTGVIIKSKYARLPVLSSLVKHFLFVDVDSTSHGSIGKALDKCRRILESGRNLLIFPEGVRSASARLGPFRNTAFRLAIEARVPVVPTIVHASVPFMTKRTGTLFPRTCVRYSVRFL